MSIKKLLLIVLAASAVMLAVGIGSRFGGAARALPATQTGVTVSYSGTLTDAAGQPVADGAYDFTFTLYAAETGGAPLWSETQEGVTVQGGSFIALLGSVNALPKEMLDGGARWLEVAVRGPEEAEFTLLSPRQELSTAASAAPAGLAAPANGLSCAHTHWGEVWSGSSLGLQLQSSDGNALVGYSAGSTYAAVYGRNTNSTGANYGVYGRSDSSSGVGVYGRGADAAIYGDGDVKQNLTGNGLVKAGVYLNCNNDLILGSIREFNNVTSSLFSYSAGSGGDGHCTIDFGFDISDRFWVATADMGGLVQGPYSVTCMLGSSNDQLDCFRYLANTGAGIDGNIMVLVY